MTKTFRTLFYILVIAAVCESRYWTLVQYRKCALIKTASRKPNLSSACSLTIADAYQLDRNDKADACVKNDHLDASMTITKQAAVVSYLRRDISPDELLRQLRLGSIDVTPKTVTPECFNRGSSPIPPGFPLKACGNDGFVGELEAEGTYFIFHSLEASVSS